MAVTIPVVIPPIPQVPIAGQDQVNREWWRWFDSLNKRLQADEEQLVLQALALRLVS